MVTEMVWRPGRTSPGPVTTAVQQPVPKLWRDMTKTMPHLWLELCDFLAAGQNQGQACAGGTGYIILLDTDGSMLMRPNLRPSCPVQAGRAQRPAASAISIGQQPQAFP